MTIKLGTTLPAITAAVGRLIKVEPPAPAVDEELVCGGLFDEWEGLGMDNELESGVDVDELKVELGLC